MKLWRNVCLAMMTALLMLIGCGFSMSVQAAESVWKWPVPSSSQMNQYWSQSHGGIDIGGSRGCDIVASKSGTVYKVLVNGVESSNWGGYGNGVIINHGDGYYSHYAHMDSTCVSEGQWVSQGQKIGTMGATGNATGVHLHFAVKTGSKGMYGGPTGSINNNPGSFYTDSSSTTSSITWSSSVTNITETNATVSARITLPSTVQFQWAGCNFYDMNGNMIAQAGENTSVKNSYMNIWYNITNETWKNITLSPGLTYQYQFYATYNSVDHFSPMYTFTTAGTHTHTYQSSIITAATCQKSGVRRYRCSNTYCGYSYDQAVGKALGHNWTSKVTKKATVFKNGTKTYTCSRCSTKKTKTIEKLKPVIKLSATSATLKKGKTKTITVVKMAYGDSVKSWASSNKKIATVSKNGKITAKKKGTATITVKLKSGKKATVKVKVK